MKVASPTAVNAGGVGVALTGVEVVNPIDGSEMGRTGWRPAAALALVVTYPAW